MLLSFILNVLLTYKAYALPLSVNTDLGRAGNNDVAINFNAYKSAFEGGGCQSFGSGHKVIVTGFGLFTGVNYNISGAVISSMADDQFFPGSIDLNQDQPFPNRIAQDGVLKNSKYGVEVRNRELRLNDKLFEVCFITVNVEWDLAAAIFLNEATAFQPELIVMSGRGSNEVSIEVGALNNATQSSGYDSSGDSIKINLPNDQRAKILNDYNFNSSLPLTWNAQKISDSIASKVAALGENLEVQNSARPENNYVCNNVSFILAHASQNKSTSLAGGKLILPNPNFKTIPKIGFFHFPAVDGANPDIANYSEKIFSWTEIMAQVIYSQF